MGKHILLLIALVACSASAQVVSGSIVVLNFTGDKIVVAADSLAVNQSNGVPDYRHCKIAAFRHQLIFTSVGNSGFVSPFGAVLWDNTALARDAVHDATTGGSSDIDAAINRWAMVAKNHWDSVSRIQAREIAEKNNWQFTAGAFFGKGLNTKVAVVEYDVNNPFDPIREEIADGSTMQPCWPCGQLRGARICAAGQHLEIIAPFCSKRKNEDRIDVRTRLKKASPSTKLPVKIVEMIIDAYGKTAKDVGGDIDAITITKDGSITWNSRKRNCPENQD